MIFDRYLLKNLLVAMLFTAISLAAIIMLTQSLRFLELIINSGASSLSFFLLTFLAMPRFFEVILPIALMISVVFIYNRLSSDSEIVVMKAAGFSPMRLSRPALALGIVVTGIVFVITAWVAPLSLSKMQMMRVAIKEQYSALLLREGVFNQIGRDLTVYVHQRGEGGALLGLLIHDTRDPVAPAVTVIAERGIIVADEDGQQVVVFDGSRQRIDPQTGALSRLDFERYSLDLPESGPARQRWREPDERTLPELLRAGPQDFEAVTQRREFMVEAHRRIVSPFLAMTFAVVGLSCLLLGGADRRGFGMRIVVASACVVLLQGFYLVAYNLSKEGNTGLILMYVVAFAPLAAGLYALSAGSEGVRARLSRVFSKAV
jgi:lipopolysaccharide export system permease protein